MVSSSISLRPFANSVAVAPHTKSTISGNTWESLGFSKSANFRTNKLLCAKGFKLNCSIDREMDVSTSAVVDAGVADCLSEEGIREPSISTMVMNFENKFDPYCSCRKSPWQFPVEEAEPSRSPRQCAANPRRGRVYLQGL